MQKPGIRNLIIYILRNSNFKSLRHCSLMMPQAMNARFTVQVE